MNKIIVTLICTYLYCTVQAQCSYTKGIYTNIYDLQDKSTKEDYNFIEIKPLVNESNSDESKVKFFKLTCKSELKEDKKILKKQILAYCDGKKLYINGAEFGLFQAYYPIISNNENFLTFYAKSADKNNTNPFYGAGALESLAYYVVSNAVQNGRLRLYYLDIHKNYAEPLTPKNLKWLLKNKPEILKQYKAENKKIIKSDSVLIKYVTMLNQ